MSVSEWRCLFVGPPPAQVSLHNSALINMDSDPTGGFKKLNFLLQSPPFPPETFNNLLLL
jgi:tetratricopeptide repeat protein 30